MKSFEPMVALKSSVNEDLAKFWGIPFSESGSQGPLEALALVVALHRRDKLRGSFFFIHNDSVVALAMVRIAGA